MPHRPVTAASLGLFVALILAACGGSDDATSTSDGAAQPSTAPAQIDIETIGRSDEETWVTLADRWADTALDEANTVGELLNDPRDFKRLLNRTAPKLRDRVVGALEELGPRCRALDTEVPPAPPGLEEPARYLRQACQRFGQARSALIDGLDAGDEAVVARGLKRLAGGVNAIASAKAAIAPPS